MAPMYANAYMYAYEMENNFSIFQQHIVKYFHFIDDVFIIWRGTVSQAHAMVEYLNHLPLPVRMTARISMDKIQFLDLEIKMVDSSLSYSLFSKPTDRNTILHSNSAHPKPLIDSIPYAQYRRVIRNNSDNKVMQTQIDEMTDKFLERGYRKQLLDKALEKAQNAHAEKESMTPPRLVFPITYHNKANQVANIVRKNWNMLSLDTTLPPIFKEPPMICYRRNKNLRDLLVNTDPVRSYQQEQK
ncbi:Hypothetical predicted protein, partial [Pelobates cultripes]